MREIYQFSWDRSPGKVVERKACQKVERGRDEELRGSAKRLQQGLVNFVPDLAHHICLILPAAFTDPGQSLVAEPCTAFMVLERISPIFFVHLLLLRICSFLI